MATKPRKKMVMEVGKKYKGHGWLNEYGQINFEATQSRESPGNMKLVKETESFSLYESANLIKVSCKITKSTDKFEMIKEFMTAFKAACVELKNYEIDK